MILIYNITHSRNVDILQQFIPIYVRNCSAIVFYHISDVVSHDSSCKPFATRSSSLPETPGYISAHANIPRAIVEASSAKFGLTNYRRDASPREFSDDVLYLSYQSVLTCSPRVERAPSFMLYVDGMRAWRRSKKKICKMIHVARGIAREQARGLNEKPAKGNDVKQRKYKEGEKQSA